MKATTKKWLALALAGTLAVSAFAGCDSAPAETTAPSAKEEGEALSSATAVDAGDGYAWEKNKDQETTLSIYYPVPGSAWENWGNDPTSKRITEMTGISFNVVAPVTNGDQKLSLMIASDELPDLVLTYYNEPAWGEMIKNKQLADMEALADQYAPKLKDLISDTAWEYARREDGAVYNVTSFVRSPEEQKWVTDNNVLVGTNQTVILMRQDYLEEIGSPGITSAEEFMAAMEKVKKNHPDCLPFYGGGALLTGPNHMLTYFGIGKFYEENGTISQSYRNPKYIDMYKWMNQMAAKGLLTKDSFIDTADVFIGKTKQGLPAAYTWTVGETGKIPANNPDTTYQPMKPWDTYEQVRMNTGYFSFGVSAKSKNQERVMDWLEFSNTVEGVKTTKWGVEGDAYGNVEDGPHFHYVEGGEPKYFKEFLDTKIADWDGTCRTSGLDCFHECLVNDVLGDKVAWDPADPLISRMNEWYGDRVVYQDEYIFTIPSGSEEMVVSQKIKDLIKEYNIKWVFAKDEAEVETLYTEFLGKVEAAGEDKLNKLYTEQWTANKARLGL